MMLFVSSLQPASRMAHLIDGGVIIKNQLNNEKMENDLNVSPNLFDRKTH